MKAREADPYGGVGVGVGVGDGLGLGVGDGEGDGVGVAAAGHVAGARALTALYLPLLPSLLFTIAAVEAAESAQ